MARLDFDAPPQAGQWLDVRFLPCSPDTGSSFGVEVTLSRVGEKTLWTAIYSTAGWQEPLVYFQSLGRAFLRISDFASPRFPIGYYEDPSSGPPACTLHLNIEWMQVFVRGLRSGAVAVTVFVQDPSSMQFVRLAGSATTQSVRRFASNLLAEVNSIQQSDQTGE